MNILLVTPRYPFPEEGGDLLRINNIARHLHAEGHKTHLISLCRKSRHTLPPSGYYDTVRVVRQLNFFSFFYMLIALFLNRPLQTGYFFSFKMLFLLRNELKRQKYDIIIIHLIRMAPYFLFLKHVDNCIVEMTDVLSKTYGQISEHGTYSLKELAYRIEKRRVERFEKKIISVFPKIVFASSADANYYGKNANVYAYPNGINLPVMRERRIVNKYKIVFLGNMRSLQNEDGALYFIREILPLIQEQISGIQFFVIGSNPSVRLRSFTNDYVHISGFVDDIYENIRDAALMVAPIRFAAGIQNKVLVGMSIGIPVVLTSLLTNGIPELKDQENCLIADRNDEFADKCVYALKNPEKLLPLIINARKLVASSYSWDSNLDGYESIDAIRQNLVVESIK